MVAWTSTEDRKLIRMNGQGMKPVSIGRVLRRPPQSVRSRLALLEEENRLTTADDALLAALERHHGDKARINAETFDDGFVR